MKYVHVCPIGKTLVQGSSQFGTGHFVPFFDFLCKPSGCMCANSSIHQILCLMYIRELIKVEIFQTFQKRTVAAANGRCTFTFTPRLQHAHTNALNPDPHTNHLDRAPYLPQIFLRQGPGAVRLAAPDAAKNVACGLERLADVKAGPFNALRMM
jgi:hypothetical protein